MYVTQLNNLAKYFCSSLSHNVFGIVLSVVGTLTFTQYIVLAISIAFSGDNEAFFSLSCLSNSLYIL